CLARRHNWLKTMAKVDRPFEFRPPGMRVPPPAFSEVGYGRRFRFPGKRAPWRDTRIACQTSITGRGTGRNIRFDPWSWLSLHRAQASGADRRRACPAVDDIPALA